MVKHIKKINLLTLSIAFVLVAVLMYNNFGTALVTPSVVDSLQEFEINPEESGVADAADYDDGVIDELVQSDARLDAIIKQLDDFQRERDETGSKMSGEEYMMRFALDRSRYNVDVYERIMYDGTMPGFP
jgi:hypothetical protein